MNDCTSMSIIPPLDNTCPLSLNLNFITSRTSPNLFFENTLYAGFENKSSMRYSKSTQTIKVFPSHCVHGKMQGPFENLFQDDSKIYTVEQANYTCPT